jgi:hypothetical protein
MEITRIRVFLRLGEGNEETGTKMLDLRYQILEII